MKSVSRGHLKAGIDSVRSAKLRSFWTMLGVIIGVTSVITIVALGIGIKRQVSGQIHHFGTNIITIRPAQLHAGDSNGTNAASSSQNLNLIAGLTTSGTLTAKDVDTVSQSKGIAASAPLTIVPGNVRGDQGAYNDGFVIGTTSDLSSLLNQSMAYGTFLSDNSGETNMAVLGQHASQALFNEDVPLGRSFTFHGQQFIVAGVFNQFNEAPLSQQIDFNNAIFIPNGLAEQLTNSTAPTYEILARALDASKTAGAATSIRQALDKSHGGQSGFSILAGNQNLAASDNILEALTRLIAGVAAISLLVSGIGIMNVMLVSVAERRHEIGIRKAVGATNRQILSQFMIESTVLSLTGGIIGIGLAFVIDLSLHLVTTLQPVITWQIVAAATGVSLLVGIVFGSIPAFQAARKDPIDALRSE
jgi:ABC-type antimicrobial peptide transport system permease subunit